MGRKRQLRSSKSASGTGQAVQVTLPVLQEPENEEAEMDLLDYNYDLPGSLPGTLHIPEDAEPTELVLISYDAEQSVQKRLQTPEECLPYLEQNMVCWLDVRGLGTEEVLRQVGGIFGLHALLLEDVVNVPHRPKLEFYEDHLLMIVHMVRPARRGHGFTAEQVSFV